MDWLNLIADLVGIVGAIFAIFSWLKARQIQQELHREQQRQNRKITVVLSHGANQLELPVKLRRAELTRAELLGRIGMLPMKKLGERFSLGYLSTPGFLQRINELIESANDSTLTIPCTQDEIEQFNIVQRP
jgi:hypothetical protein